MKFIKDLLQKSNSKQNFSSKLRSVGITLDYSRDGSIKGVIDTNGKPYSWSKLGVSKEDLLKFEHRTELTHLDKRLQRLEFLQTIRDKSRSKSKDKER